MRWLRLGGLPALLLLLSATTSPQQAVEPLPERFEQWLEEVDPLILGKERRVFLSLKTDYQRDAFVSQFWRVRDPFSKTARNEFKVRYEGRVHQARARWGKLADDRARIYLVHGEPAAKLVVRCGATYKPVEIWRYDGSEQVSFQLLMIFLVPREGPAVLYHPDDGAATNQLANAFRCLGGEQLQLALSTIEAERLDWELAFQRMLAKPRPRQQEWLATFKAFTTEVPATAETFEAELAFAFPARHQNRTVVQGMATVGVDGVVAGDYLGFRSYNFELIGEVILDDRLFENFRYKFAFPEQVFDGATIPMAFQRYLRPGDYRLILRLEDTNGGRFFRSEHELVVPRVEQVFELTGSVDSVTERLFAEATAAMSRGETSIQLIPPRSILQTGFVRFDTMAVGEDIAKVAFILDEDRLLTKNRPPFNVEIDLGEFPRPHTLRVEALDRDGAIVATDEIQINSSGQTFAVTLLEPRREASYSASLLARARVDLPDEATLDRVEFYLNERLMATLYQPPFSQPIALPPGEELTYVRAMAYLADGTSAEDLVFINAPDYLEEVDVQVVELYVTVLDSGGRPVMGLTERDFEVFEDKMRQKIQRFEAVASQPFKAGILFDNSASMRPVLDYARVAALTFFRDALTPRDRAAVITFNRLPRLAVGLTNDLRLLGGGLAGVTAEGDTALYDSIMFGLYYLAGVKGQRALLLLSDGKDEASRFKYTETLDYARRAGVAVYVIGLNLQDSGVRSRLDRLAGETGGRSFFITDLTKLGPIYSLIQEELRAQYLLTYQSSQTADSESFRAVTVKLARRDLTPRTLSGYYP